MARRHSFCYDKVSPQRCGRRKKELSLAKEKTVYVCQSCGDEAARWLGCCPDCGEWNTFEERNAAPHAPAASKTAEKAARIPDDPQKREPWPC